MHFPFSINKIFFISYFIQSSQRQISLKSFFWGSHFVLACKKHFFFFLAANNTILILRLLHDSKRDTWINLHTELHLKYSGDYFQTLLSSKYTLGET